MQKRVIENGLGEKYTILGPVMQRPDLWLVRRGQTQELALLQRFVNPDAVLASVMASPCPHWPKVLDSWVDRGQIFVVLERVEGLEIPDLKRPMGLGGTLARQMESLQRTLERLGCRRAEASLLCLTREGNLRMRCLPTADRVASAAWWKVAS